MSWTSEFMRFEFKMTFRTVCYNALYAVYTVYPKKYAHGFVVLCFVVVMQSFIMNSHEVFIHIHRGCFTGTGAIVRLPQCQWSKPDGYGKISQCITTTKHSKAKTVCIFLGIYCNRMMCERHWEMAWSGISVMELLLIILGNTPLVFGKWDQPTLSSLRAPQIVSMTTTSTLYCDAFLRICPCALSAWQILIMSNSLHILNASSEPRAAECHRRLCHALLGFVLNHLAMAHPS